MFKKIKKMLLLEKIPTIVCLLACTASVLMGFAVGYIFFGPGEYALAYGDTPSPYQAESPYLAGMPAEIYEPCDEPVFNYAETVEEQDAPSYLYVVTTLDGYIVVYHATEYGGGIKEMTSTAVGALAPEELERLAVGIRIYTEEALARILQDYGS